MIRALHRLTQRRGRALKMPLLRMQKVVCTFYLHFRAGLTNKTSWSRQTFGRTLSSCLLCIRPGCCAPRRSRLPLPARCLACQGQGQGTSEDAGQQQRQRPHPVIGGRPPVWFSTRIRGLEGWTQGSDESSCKTGGAQGFEGKFCLSFLSFLLTLIL